MADSVTETMDGYVVDYISNKQVKGTPEEIEAVQPFSKKLVEDYGYPVTNIMTHPQHRVKVRPSDEKKEYPVDIAVFIRFFPFRRRLLFDCRMQEENAQRRARTT